MDDVRLFSPTAAIAGGRGTRRWPEPLAGAVAGGGAARSPGDRRGGGVRVYCGVDRILFCPRADQPLRVHAADGVPGLSRVPRGAVRGSLRTRDDIARALA